jgi:hypothetical protein
MADGLMGAIGDPSLNAFEKFFKKVVFEKFLHD